MPKLIVFLITFFVNQVFTGVEYEKASRMLWQTTDFLTDITANNVLFS